MSDERLEIDVERLVMELPFREKRRGQSLTAEIVRRLRQMPELPTPKSPTRIADLRVDLPLLSPTATDGETAALVATSIHRALVRALESAGAGPAARPRSGPPFSGGASGPTPAPDRRTATPRGAPLRHDAGAAVAQSVRAGGASLPEVVRAPMQRGLDADLGDVRVHTGDTASAVTERLDAEAVTVGNDIFFRAGRFRPDTAEGQRLLAHEVIHVAQQRLEGAPASEPALEREASASAGRVAAGEPASVRHRAAPEAAHTKRTTRQPERHAERETTFGDFYVATFVVQGIDIRLAILAKDQAHVVARLADIAAALAKVNRRISDQKLKIRRCVIAQGQESRFATYNGAPIAVISAEDAMTAAAFHEGGHAVFASLRSATGKNAAAKHNIAGRLAAIFAELSETTKVTRRLVDPSGNPSEESHPVGLWMLDPTQWNGDPKGEHPWQDADEMFASALEAFQIKPAGLRRAIAQAAGVDRRVAVPAKELLRLLATTTQGRTPNAPEPSSEAEKALADIGAPLELEEVIGSRTNVTLKWALEPDTVPDGD